MKQVSIRVNSLGQTNKLATDIANNLKGGEVLCLIGELGVGKTYFVKFFSEALGISGEEVISPTFVYWRKHQGSDFKLNHFDFYRIDDEDEVKDIGIEEAFDEEESITIIEWADKIKNYLPEERLEIHFVYLGRTERQVNLRIYGKKLEYLLKGIEESEK